MKKYYETKDIIFYGATKKIHLVYFDKTDVTTNVNRGQDYDKSANKRIAATKLCTMLDGRAVFDPPLIFPDFFAIPSQTALHG